MSEVLRWIFIKAIGLLVGGMVLGACARNVSDADVRAKIERVLADYPNVVVGVSAGDVTLSGTVINADEGKSLMERVANADPNHIKKLVNNVRIAAPAGLTADGDAALRRALRLITKEYPTVRATADNDTIRVTGSIRTVEVGRLQMALDTLNPAAIDMSMLKVGKN